MLNGMPQAVSENLSLKQKIFKELAAELRPDTILATNTSSISITKIAASAVPEGIAPASEEGKQSTSRVVGTSFSRSFGSPSSFSPFPRTPLLQSGACHGTFCCRVCFRNSRVDFFDNRNW